MCPFKLSKRTLKVHFTPARLADGLELESAPEFFVSNSFAPGDRLFSSGNPWVPRVLPAAKLAASNASAATRGRMVS